MRLLFESLMQLLCEFEVSAPQLFTSKPNWVKIIILRIDLIELFWIIDF